MDAQYLSTNYLMNVLYATWSVENVVNIYILVFPWQFDPHTNMTRAQVNIEYGFTYCLKSPNQMADPRSCPIDTTRPHYLCSVFVMHSPNHVTALEVVPILDDSNDIHCEMRVGYCGHLKLTVLM